MATQLPRPGVEVIQEFVTANPTVVTPTLVPCVVAPYFEVIEVLKDDGTINPEAELNETYDQLEMLVSQSSFPSPRKNIDQVNVLEDTIRAFLDFGGVLSELQRDEAFLTSENIATQPHLTSPTAGPYSNLAGKTLVVQFDSHTALPVNAGALPVSADVSIEFVGGSSLTIDQVVAQVNAVIPGVASKDGTSHLVLTSLNYGAGASVVLRESGTANGILGFDTGSGNTYVAVGAGFYAKTDSDSDTVSPWIELYRGTTQKKIGDSDTGLITAINFVSESIKAGDTVVCDGVSIGDIYAVTSSRLTMEVEQNIFGADSPFHPRYFWVRANGLTYPVVGSAAATLTGSRATAAATQAYIVGATASATSAAGNSFTVSIVKAGVSLGSETVTVPSSGGYAGPWDTLAKHVAGINSLATKFQAYYANKYGDELPSTSTVATFLGLRTLGDNTGSGAAISYDSASSGMNTGIVAGTSDIGENIRFQPGTLAAVWDSANAFAAKAPLVSTETVIYTPLQKGAATDPTSETITWSGNHASIGAAIADWNNQARFTQAYEANVAGVETVLGGYFAIRTRGENVGTGASIHVTGTDSKTTIPTGSAVTGTSTPVDGVLFKWSLDQNPHVYEIALVADEDDSNGVSGGLSLAQVISKINNLTPGVAAASSDSPPKLKLTSQKLGKASKMTVVDCTAKTGLGFDPIPTAATGSGRPNPDIAIDISGNLLVQGQILRDSRTGIPYDNGLATMYLSYKGLRLDLSPDADNPSLITWSNVSQLEELAPPISADNPGSLMSYLALLSAPSISVTSIGVPEVSADAPDGTPEGYAKCLSFLQSEEVYALALASKNPVIHQSFLTHVQAMSEPEEKGERIVFFCPEEPDRAVPTTVGSGTDANSTSNENELTIEVNIAPALIALGLDPTADLNPATGDIENEIYLDIGSTDKKYLVKKVTNGTLVKLRTSFVAGDGNEDGFFSTDTFPASVISDSWSVLKRGAPLVLAGSTYPDKDKIAETIQAVALAYGTRRGYYVFPDGAGINVTGLEQVVDGYYSTAVVIGMVGQQPPQQGFTNYPMTCLTKVVGSNYRFTEKQMAVMAAGGVYILIQEVEGAPVICRHQL